MGGVITRKTCVPRSPSACTERWLPLSLNTPCHIVSVSPREDFRELIVAGYAPGVFYRRSIGCRSTANPERESVSQRMTSVVVGVRVRRFRIEQIDEVITDLQECAGELDSGIGRRRAARRDL